MRDADRIAFAKVLRTTLLTCGGSAPDADVIFAWWGALAEYEMEDVATAFALYVKRGKYAPRPGDIQEILERIRPDGRPGADEAWAMIPEDEAGSVVWSTEMAEAYGIARPLLASGDKIAARMAFKSAYARIVERNKLANVAPVWTPSPGTDPADRERALAEAVRLGRLTADHAVALIAPDRVAPMLDSAGVKLVGYEPASPEVVSENLSRMRDLLSRSTIGRSHESA